MENHQVVSEAITALLNAEADLLVVGHAQSVAECEAKVWDLDFDVALVDFYLDDGDGAQAASKIRQSKPNAKVIFWSRDDGHGVRYAAMEAGANGLLHKAGGAEKIVSGIRTVARGESLFNPTVISELLREQSSAEVLVSSLTAREKDVLVRLSRAEATRDIASQLRISYSTVRSYVGSLERKLGVHSKLEAVSKARNLHLID